MSFGFQNIESLPIDAIPTPSEWAVGLTCSFFFPQNFFFGWNYTRPNPSLLSRCSHFQCNSLIVARQPFCPFSASRCNWCQSTRAASCVTVTLPRWVCSLPQHNLRKRDSPQRPNHTKNPPLLQEHWCTSIVIRCCHQLGSSFIFSFLLVRKHVSNRYGLKETISRNSAQIAGLWTASVHFIIPAYLLIFFIIRCLYCVVYSRYLSNLQGCTDRIVRRWVLRTDNEGNTSALKLPCLLFLDKPSRGAHRPALQHKSILNIWIARV